ncbi:GLPGLI family protein [Seonamhaeicola marinus]|uniref:GLPGLI family protein n=1 Tax=Seonamhaeicola marinus TaxID=1912246 RepID=A0A5D0HX68_9FLAO|nr:GLPGLI family protein [Seonamhaeicola marinus]TYA74737.1 GLPGLI family protein [Seonamhaeicola marinus]
MNRTFILFSMLSVLFITVNAQDFQGMATYKTKRKLDIPVDSTQMNSDMYKRVTEMLKKQFEKTYVLSFDKGASLYKEDKGLEAPQAAGMRMVVMTAGQSDILYKNIKENRFTSQSEVLGKIFLVKDELETHDWTLENETKHIGDYTCHKATKKRMIPIVESRISFNEAIDREEEEQEPEMKEVTVTAWYTMQIPVNSGPGRFHGLPGLILEVNDGEETIVCSKIVLNPENKVTLNEPSKGKEVNREDFNKIVQQKMKEQREKYEHRRHDGNSQRVEIRIGG